MAGRSGVEVDLRPLTVSVQRLVSRVGDMGEQEARRAASAVAAQAAAAVPRRSGALAATVHASGDTVSYGGGLPYAKWVEHGGNRPHPRPYKPKGYFFWPAVADAAQRFVQGAKTGTKTAVAKM